MSPTLRLFDSSTLEAMQKQQCKAWNDSAQGHSSFVPAGSPVMKNSRVNSCLTNRHRFISFKEHNPPPSCKASRTSCTSRRGLVAGAAPKESHLPLVPLPLGHRPSLHRRRNRTNRAEVDKHTKTPWLTANLTFHVVYNENHEASPA